MSLCTFRDLPWNGPFYARLGFVEVRDPAPYQRRLTSRRSSSASSATGSAS